jgi:protein TonB
MPVSPAAPTPQAVPLPQTPPPVQETTPAPETERPASTVTENFSGLQAEPTGYASVSASFVRPDLREAAINRYAMTIRGLIDRRKEYPYQARRQDQEGSVQLRFTLSRQGALSGEPVLEKQSRYRLLNESAIAAIKNAAPFPPFPEEIMEEEMSFQVVVSFSL